MTLNEIRQGDRCRVTALNLDAEIAGRLQSLGMIPGTQVSVLQKKGSGTMVIDLRGTRFALGSPITKRIEVAHV